MLQQAAEEMSVFGGQGRAGAACAHARQVEDLGGADLARMDDSDPDGVQPGDDVGRPTTPTDRGSIRLDHGFGVARGIAALTPPPLAVNIYPAGASLR